jgi:hypothetical protein
MKVSNNQLGVKIYLFIVILGIFGSCSNEVLEASHRKAIRETRQDHKITQSTDSGLTFECYMQKDIDLADTSKTMVMLKKISNIKEVQKFSEFHSDTILYWLMEGSIYENSYEVNVGLDYGDHYSTTYIFYVNKSDEDVKILEIVEHSLMSIEDWRKNPYYETQQNGIFGK